MLYCPSTIHPARAVPPGFRTDLPRWQHLVSADWLAAWLAQQTVAAPPARDWLLLEVACDGLAAFLHSHIPGARYADTRQFEHLPYWNALAPPALLPVLQHLGIGPQTTVILYARNSLAAARVAHILLATGLQDVRLLDGGLAVWCAGGHALAHGNAAARESEPAQQRQTDPRDWQPQTDYLIHTAEVRWLRTQANSALVSIRTRAEFTGETSGYSYIQRRGEIAGALWGHAGVDGDVNSMRNFQDDDGRMLPAADIARIWLDAGIRPDMRVVFYCGTGWRASLAFYYAWLMGWPRISVYDGGWFEWSSDAANPSVCRVDENPVGAGCLLEENGARAPCQVPAYCKG